MSAPTFIPQISPQTVDRQCNICLDNMEVPSYRDNNECSFTPDGRAVRFACGHAYHAECCKRQLAAGTSQCATCRKDISDRGLSVINQRLGTQFTHRTADDVAADVLAADGARRDTASQENLGLWGAERRAAHRAEPGSVRRRRSSARNRFAPYERNSPSLRASSTRQDTSRITMRQALLVRLVMATLAEQVLMSRLRDHAFTGVGYSGYSTTSCRLASPSRYRVHHQLSRPALYDFSSGFNPSRSFAAPGALRLDYSPFQSVQFLPSVSSFRLIAAY